MFVAFATSSSAATLPVSLNVAKMNGQVSSDVANFVLPLGSTINMVSKNKELITSFHFSVVFLD